MKKWEGPTTNSLKRRGRKVAENGVVEDKAWPAIVAGICAVGIGVILILVYFF